jgi:hypothetical protein
MTAAAPVLFLHALGGMRNGAFLRRFGTNSMRVAWAATWSRRIARDDSVQRRLSPEAMGLAFGEATNGSSRFGLDRIRLSYPLWAVVLLTSSASADIGLLFLCRVAAHSAAWQYPWDLPSLIRSSPGSLPYISRRIPLAFESMSGLCPGQCGTNRNRYWHRI